MPCRPVNIHPRSERVYCLHLRHQAVPFSEYSTISFSTMATPLTECLVTLRNGSPKAAIAKCGTSNVFSAALLLIAQTRICPHSHKNITKFYVVLLAIQHEVSCQISTAIMVVFVNVAYWLTNRKVRRWLNDSTL